jgi:hypothetical protein
LRQAFCRHRVGVSDTIVREDRQLYEYVDVAGGGDTSVYRNAVGENLQCLRNFPISAALTPRSRSRASAPSSDRSRLTHDREPPVVVRPAAPIVSGVERKKLAPE